MQIQASDMLAFTSLRIEREGLVKQVNMDITSETFIEGHRYDRPYGFRIPITRKTLAELRESHIELAKRRRRYGQAALDAMSAAREAVNAYLETQYVATAHSDSET